MALVKGRETTTAPSVGTNLGQEVAEQKKEQKDVSTFNKELVKEGISFDPATSAVNTAGFAQAMSEYNKWLNSEQKRVVDAVSIKIDDASGDIKVSAPSQVMKSPLVKQTYDDALKSISQMYKRDPEYAFALMKDSDETKTAAEWVKDIEDDFKSRALEFSAREEAKEKIFKDKGIQLSDDDLTKMNTVAIEFKSNTGEKIKVDDKTMQAIPESVIHLPVFKSLEGWDEESHVVSWGDLKKVWNRDNTSDEDILELFNEVDAYFEKGDFSNPTEYAEMSALYNFINSKDPSVSFWRGSGEFIGGILEGLWEGGATLDSNLLSAAETIGNFGANIIEATSYAVSGLSFGEAWEEAEKDDGTFLRDYVAPALDEMVAERQKRYKRLNDTAAAGHLITEAITPVVLEIAISVAAGNAAASYAKTSISRIVDKIAYECGTTSKLMASLTASNIAAGGASIENITKGMYAGLKTMMMLSDKATRIATAVKAIGAVRAAHASVKAISAAVKVADVAAQAAVDIVLTDPKMFRELLESDDPEAKAYALEQVVQNTVGEIAGVGLGKMITRFTNTDLGRLLNAKAGVKVSGLKASIGEATEKMKIAVLHGGDPDWLVKKASDLSEEAKRLQNTWLGTWAENRAGKAERQLQNLRGRRFQRAADIKSAALAENIKGETWDDLIESAQKVTNERRLYIAEANLLADVDARYDDHIHTTLSKILEDNPKLKMARDDYLESLSAVLKAEDAAGLGKAIKTIKLPTGVEFRPLDKSVNEYVEALYRVREADAVIKLSDVAENVRGAKVEFDHYSEVIKDFKQAQPELANILEQHQKSAIRLSEQTQETKVALGVLSQDTLDAQRASGFFDQGYLRQQRVKDWNNYRKSGGQLKIAEVRGMQNYRWGDTSEWQDLSLVLFDDMEETARRVVRKEQTRALKDLGFKVEVRVDAEGVRVVEEVNPVRKKATDTILHNADTVVKNMDDSIFNDVFDFKKKSLEVKKANIKAANAGAGVARAKAADYSVTDRGLRRAIRDTSLFDDDFINDAVEFHIGKPFSEFTDEDVTQFLKDAPEQTKKVMRRNLSQLRGEAMGGLVSKSDLPKIRTSDYTRATGYKYKDAPDWMKPYLSKNGVPMDDKSIYDVMDMFYPSAGTTREWMDDDVLDVYEQTINRDMGRSLTIDNFTEAIGYDPSAVNRSLLENNYNGIWDNGDIDIRGTVEGYKRGSALLDAETLYKDNLKRLSDLRAKYDLPNLEDNLNDSIDEFIDSAIDNNANNKSVMQALNALGDSTAGGEDLVEYATLKSLADNRKKIVDQFYKKAVKEYNAIITDNINLKYADDPKRLEKARKSVSKIAKNWADESSRWFEERLMQRFNEIQGRLVQQGSDIVDMPDYFKKVDILNKQISEASAAPNVIKTYGAYGYEEYVELSPTVASMFTMRPRAIRRGPFGTIQQAFVRAFRRGTTGGFVPGSLVNQGFRDTGHALASGNAWLSNKAVQTMLEDEFGDTVAEYLQRNMPDVWEALTKQADETGASAQKLAVQREMKLGALNIDNELESTLYQFGRESRMRRTAEGIYDQSKIDKITDALDEWGKKSEFLNNMRETHWRKSVYNNNLLIALRDGMSVEEARRFAVLMQAEATTNFTRQTYHLANMTRTVPYLGAAINGKKSFWRLFALDPVGVSTRVLGGFVVPVIALTATSLSDEENRRIYKQIPEYEKSGNLVFVISGQILSIPIPEEISNIVRPLQHMVESMYNANDNSFAELMANDLLGSFPVDLSGFQNIDADHILSGNLVSDHLIPGFAKASSQLMPPLVKSGFMYATGVDPYTMKKIDTAYVNIDPETGERIVMDYTSGAIAKGLGNVLGDFMSAQMAQKILTNLLGKGTMMWLDGLGDIIDAAADSERSVLDGIKGLGESVITSATDRLTVPRYGEESNQAWNRAVSQLYAEKEQLLTDKEYQADLKALSNKELTDEARDKIKSRVATREQEYLQRVLDAANNLIDKYEGTFDKNKLGSVISLMNLDLDNINENPYNKYATYLSQEEYNLNKAIAVETMVKLGFPSTNDQSVFGYYSEDANGNIKIQYSSPLAILNYNYTNWSQADVTEAEIRSILKDAGISRSDMFGDEYNKANSAGKKALKEYKASWNKKVVKALSPYIQSRGVEGVLNSSSTRDLLDNYIFVDNLYKTEDYLLNIFGGK